jgi:hypothetical protein
MSVVAVAMGVVPTTPADEMANASMVAPTTGPSKEAPLTTTLELPEPPEPPEPPDPPEPPELPDPPEPPLEPEVPELPEVPEVPALPELPEVPLPLLVQPAKRARVAMQTTRERRMDRVEVDGVISCTPFLNASVQERRYRTLRRSGPQTSPLKRERKELPIAKRAAAGIAQSC